MTRGLMMVFNELTFHIWMTTVGIAPGMDIENVNTLSATRLREILLAFFNDVI